MRDVDSSLEAVGFEILELDPTVESLDKPLGDGQAESRSAPAPRVKRFPHPLELLFRDAISSIAYDQRNPIGSIISDHLHHPPVGGKLANRLDRVEHQIQENLP